LGKLVRDLEAAEICTLYDIDLHPAQRYLFAKHLDSFGKFTIEHNADLGVTSLSVKDCEVAPPVEVLHIRLDAGEDLAKKELSDSRFEVLTAPRDLSGLYALMRRICMLALWWLLLGKVIIDSETVQTLGVAGLDEKSRFVCLPIGVVARWGSARVIDSRQRYESIKRGILIPRTRTGTVRNVLTAKEVAYTEISLAKHYRYLVLLPQEPDPEIEAT